MSGSSASSAADSVPADRVMSFHKFLRIVSEGDSHREHKQPFCFVLGAGASFTSGVPTGSKMVDDWLARLHSDANTAEPVEKWATAKNLGIEGFVYERRAEFYSKVYDACWRGQEEDGLLYLQRAMKDARPSYGYAVLAQLVSRRHRAIITTNFDSLASDALFLFGAEAPFVCGHERLIDYIPEHSTRPVVIKLHHDLLGRPHQ